MNDFIFLDYISTTPIRQEIREIIKNSYDIMGNPSSNHCAGRLARDKIEESRLSIANSINSNPNEIYFTSGASESNSWALTGFVTSRNHNKNEILVSSIEHSSIMRNCAYLESLNYSIKYIPVDSMGTIKMDIIENMITERTGMISTMLANNEIATIEPIEELSKICKRHNIVLHSDITSAIPYMKIDVEKLGIDMASFSAHKFGALKGCGVLYKKDGIDIDPIVFGGQHDGYRGGTENTIGILAMSKALELTVEEMEINNKHYQYLINRLESNILNNIVSCGINGNFMNRIPNLTNISFKDVDSESLLLLLEIDGVCASSSSACDAKKLEVSHVLHEIGVSDNFAKGTLRCSVGKETTESQIDYASELIIKYVNQLRELKK